MTRRDLERLFAVVESMGRQKDPNVDVVEQAAHALLTLSRYGEALERPSQNRLDTRLTEATIAVQSLATRLAGE